MNSRTARFILGILIGIGIATAGVWVERRYHLKAPQPPSWLFPAR